MQWCTWWWYFFGQELILVVGNINQVKCSILNLLLFNKKNTSVFCILFCFCISFMMFLLIFQSMLNHLTVGQTVVQTGLHVSAMPNSGLFGLLMSTVSLLHLAWSWAIVAIDRTVAPIGCLTLANRVNSTTATWSFPKFQHCILAFLSAWNPHVANPTLFFDVGEVSKIIISSFLLLSLWWDFIPPILTPRTHLSSCFIIKHCSRIQMTFNTTATITDFVHLFLLLQFHSVIFYHQLESSIFVHRCIINTSRRTVSKKN